MPLRTTILMALLLVLAACSKAERAAPTAATVPVGAPAATGTQGAQATGVVSAALAQPVTSRRVIRTAEVSLDADAPEAATARLASIAESSGGFVVSSDTTRATDADGAELVMTTIVFRVPAASFEAALAAVRAAGTRVSSEKVTGQDVTEEYVDLEARIKAQRAVEEQYLSVLHEAKTIPDILAVQQKLGEARTEIERAEGRRRYLENQTSLSTLTVHVAKHTAAVDASGPGFGRSVREAAHDAVSVAVAIVNGGIRLLGVLLPVGVLVGLPFVLLVRWLVRRRRRQGA